MCALETAQFQDAEKYSLYLRTPAGKFRSELAWENLRGFLAVDGAKRRVLDLGGGTGFIGIRLAKMEFEVVVLDSSQEMLRIAKKEAEAEGVASRISFCQADASRVDEFFEGESFDVVVCHNLLEYVEDPEAIVAKIARVLRRNAIASFLVRNRAGEVLKAAIKSGNWEQAKSNLFEKTVVDSLYGKPVRVFDSKELLDMLRRAELDVVSQYGVRVFSDYLDSKDQMEEAADRQLFELELILGARPEFAAIARYTQFLARCSGRCRRKENER